MKYLVLLLLLIIIISTYWSCLNKEGFETYAKSTQNWQRVASCCIRDLQLDDEYAYGLGDDDAVWRHSLSKVDGSGWARITGGDVTAIAIDSAYIYGVGLDTKVWRVPKGGGSWRPFTNGGAYANCLMVANGYIYCIGNGDRWDVWRVSTSKGGAWERMAVPAVTYITHDDTYIYGVGRAHNHLVRTKALDTPTGGWDKIASCCVRQITYHDKHIFGVGLDYKVYVVKASGGNWERLDEFSEGITHIKAKGNYIYGIGTDKALWRKQINSEPVKPLIGDGRWNSPLPPKNSKFITRKDEPGKPRSLAEQLQDPYHLAPKNATSCESGSTVSQSECNEAVNFLARKNGKTPGRGLQSGSGGTCGDGAWGGVPTGCSAQTGGDWAPHLKVGQPNCNNGSYQLVCSGPMKKGAKKDTGITGEWTDGQHNFAVAQQDNKFFVSYTPGWGTGAAEFAGNVINFRWSLHPYVPITGEFTDNNKKIVWMNGVTWTKKS